MEAFAVQAKTEMKQVLDDVAELNKGSLSRKHQTDHKSLFDDSHLLTFYSQKYS